MGRILLSAPDDRPWSWGRHLARALVEMGHEVELFDFRSAERPNEDVLEAAGQFRPVLHVAWKGEAYAPQTLVRLASRGVYNVLWHPDASLPQWLPPLAAAADLCCVQSRGMLPQFRKAGIREPEWLMEGITPSCFAYEEMTSAERRDYACDVVVIGTIDRELGYRRRLHALNRLIREGVRVRWWGRRMSFRRNRLRDYFSPARRAWGGRMVWDGTYAKACHCARIFLAIPRYPHVPGGLSNRAFWVTGLGTCYLTLYRAGMEEFFEPGREVVTFADEDEMVEKVRYHLDHRSEREAIAAAGQRRTLGNHTNHHTFARLFEMVAQRGGPRL
ncbi:MAG: CgeB family protein [Planctomycetota bacterium]|jgi:hypothetical protein